MTEHPAEHANPGADTVPVLAKQMMNYAYDFDTAWDEMPELLPGSCCTRRLLTNCSLTSSHPMAGASSP